MLFRIAQIFFRIYFFLYHRASIKGLPGLKNFLAGRGGKPVILAANHESYLDPPLIGMLFPNAIRFIAWDGLFRNPIFGTLIRALGAVSVNQENKNLAASLLRNTMEFIKSGYSVLIFPEGERSPDGKLMPFEGGVALISLKTRIPIVPVWVDTFEAYPISKKIPRPRRVAVKFGEPLFPEALPQDMSEKERRETLLATLRKSMEEMRDGKA
ncbi:MAG: 1-acyl-sn-glycerol-3-phosphate acyltransferase [Synergistaceae bacterium]|nr:1-acyl-sn-glycerol-3-phosphate acyltransferase [Synergistaceae bacterium]